MRRLMRWLRRWWRWRLRREARFLLAAGGGLLLLGLVLADLLFGFSPLSRGKGLLVSAPPTRRPTPAPEVMCPSRQEAAGLVYGFNLAMEGFVLRLDPYMVYPYVHPDGPLWEEIKRTHQERARENLIHYAELVRFGVGEMEQGQDGRGPYVRLQVAEEWRDTEVDRDTGAATYEDAAVVQEVLYELRPLGTDWLIWSQRVIRVVGVPEE